MRKFLLLFFFFSYLSLNAYERTDSLLVSLSETKEDTAKLEIYLKLAKLTSRDSYERERDINKGLELAKKINKEDAISNFYYYKACYCITRVKLDEALENFLESVKYKGDNEKLIYSYGVISNIYSWRNEHDLALENAEKSLALARSVEKEISPGILAEAWAFVGDAHRYNKRMDKARNYYLAAVSILNENHYSVSTSITKSTLYMYLTNEAINMFDMMSFSMGLKDAYEYSDEEGKQRHALSLFKLAEAFTSLKEDENNKQKQIWFFLTGSIVLLIISALLVYLNYSRRKMNARLLALNEELDHANKIKANVLGIWNHDLRHPIARLVNYLQLRRISTDAIEPEMAEEIEQETMDMAMNLLHNMEELLIWCKDQMKTFKPVLNTVKISDIFEDVRSLFHYEKNVKIVFHTLDDLTVNTDENYLKIIMRNLTTNAIKAQANVEYPQIRWAAVNENGKVVLSIKDNGLGLAQSKIKMFDQPDREIPVREGLGLQIIRDLSKTLGCSIKIFSEAGKGTTFRLIFDK